MVNNSTNIDKTKNHLFPSLTEHKKKTQHSNLPQCNLPWEAISSTNNIWYFKTEYSQKKPVWNIQSSHFKVVSY
jgi:hypothetical protein